MEKLKPVIKIIGAGFSGLSLAYYLNEKGYNVEIYEKGNEPGGLIQSISTPEGLIETAANGFMGQSHVMEFFKKNNIHFVPSSKISNKRFIFRDGQPSRWPLRTFETLALLFKVLLRFILTQEAKKNLEQKSMYAWGQENFTDPAVNYLLNPGLQGIYAGDIHKLSAKLILSSLFNRQSKHKKIHSLVSHQQGCQMLLKQLAEQLSKSGVKFFYGAEVTSEWINQQYKKSVLVLATASHQALDLIKGTSLKNQIEFLKSINSLPIVSVTIFLKQKPEKKYLGFGVLFPKKEKSVRALGILMNDQIFDRQNRLHSETWIYGGALDPDILKLSDQELKNIILQDRKHSFNSEEQIEKIHITRWSKALPYYDLNLETQLNKFTQDNFLYLHGNYMGALGLSKVLDKSLTLAQEIEASL